MDLSKLLININQSLCNQGISLRIEKRGGKLNLRGPLPSKTHEGCLINQRLSLCLNADNEGLKEAQRLLQLIVLQLDRNQFQWNQWAVATKTKPFTRSVADVSEALLNFENFFFLHPNRKKSPAGARTTWTSSYLPYIRRLKTISLSNHAGKVDSAVLYETLLSYSEKSRSRQQCATSLAAVADYLKISLPESWRSESSGYGLHQAKFRQLPTDEQIVNEWNRIENPKWQIVYGLMATYGLRNHEVFFCDFEAFSKGKDPIVRVLPNTKTGEHQVWPFHPEWVNFFKLKKLKNAKESLPIIKTDLRETTLQQVGRRVSEQFRRYKIPFTPYDLRHAWAVRTIHVGLPDTVAARMMGHSVAIHTRTYHHWITRRDQQRAVDTALANQNKN